MLRIVTLIAALALTGCKEDQVSEGGDCPKLAAYSAIKDHVVRDLVSPGSAVFPPDPSGPLYSNADVLIATKSDCIFSVSSHVDSQNKFGAMLRTRFSGTAAFNRANGRWNVTGLILAPL